MKILKPETTLNTIYGKDASSSKLGYQALWDGPLNTAGMPKGKGRSSGAKGIILNLDKEDYQSGPITQRAKGRF
jgi:hypothetical protein